MTECHTQPFLFQPHGRREVLADFDGGKITSDASGLLLREVEERFALKEFGLQGTSMESAQVNTIRAKLLKIGGRITVSVRRVVLSLSQAYPYQELFREVLGNLRRRELTPLRL